MKYRAIVIGVQVDGHSLQKFTDDLAHLGPWIKSMLAQYPESTIDVYETHETKIGTYHPGCAAAA